MNEKMLISAHVDGEVEAPWNKRLDELLESDSQLRAEADKHRKIKDALSAEPTLEVESSQARVWSAVQTRLDTLRPVPLTTLSTGWVYPAAAAVLAVVLGAGYLLGTGASTSTGAPVAELRVQVPAQFHLELSGEGQLLKVSTLEGGAP